MLSLMFAGVNRYLCVPVDSGVEGLETCHVNTSISLDGVTVFLSQRISKFGCLRQKSATYDSPTMSEYTDTVCCCVCANQLFIEIVKVINLTKVMMLC